MGKARGLIALSAYPPDKKHQTTTGTARKSDTASNADAVLIGNNWVKN